MLTSVGEKITETQRNVRRVLVALSTEVAKFVSTGKCVEKFSVSLREVKVN